MKTAGISPDLLDLVKIEKEYIVYHGDSPLLTEKGKYFISSDERLLKNIIMDIQLRGSHSLAGITSYRLLEFQLDYIQNGIDFISDNFNRICSKDDLILLKTGKKKNAASVQIHPSLDLAEDGDSLLQTLFWGFSSVINNLNAFIAENIQQVEYESDDDHPFILLLKQHYLRMKPAERSAVHLLSFLHRSGIVLPLMLVLNRITASEYARGILSLHMRNQAEEDPVDLKEFDFPYLPVPVSGSDMKETFSEYFLGASEVCDYLTLVNLTGTRQPALHDLIPNGESGDLEFKSTFRWDLKAGKTNPAIERASLKTISAFLNTSGGVLLIGVRDDGSIEGIESDRFMNDDKFLLHLWTLIRTSLGRDVSPYVQTLLEKQDEKTVCIVRVTRSPKPVFIRQPGFNEEFFIRVGPSSNALDISEALRYISVRFSEQVSG